MGERLYVHENDRGKFGYFRDDKGKKRWVCISGNCPGVFGSNNMNVYVPLDYANILTKEAQKGGAPKEVFVTPKKVRESRTIRVRRKKESIGVKLFD